MGLFSGTPKGCFQITTLGISKSMSPEEYGHWLLRWSAENSFSDFQRMRSDEFALSPFARSLRNEGGGPAYLTVLQLISLTGSSYYYYASHILEVGAEVQQKMVVGIDDSLNALRIAGNSLDSDDKQIVKAAMNKYVKAAAADYASNSRGTYDPDFNQVTRVFFDVTNNYFPETVITNVDKLLIGNFLSDIQSIVMQMIKNELKLEFHQ